VYRVLKLHGLVREVNVVGFPAGPEYAVKTKRVNEQWQSDGSYFFVMGWGWYYLISVLDDFSRYILAWELKSNMKTESISEVVERAIEWTGMKRVPVKLRARLVSDNGRPTLRWPSRNTCGCTRCGTSAVHRIIRKRTGNSNGSTKR